MLRRWGVWASIILSALNLISAAPGLAFAPTTTLFVFAVASVVGFALIIVLVTDTGLAEERDPDIRVKHSVEAGVLEKCAWRGYFGETAKMDERRTPNLEEMNKLEAPPVMSGALERLGFSVTPVFFAVEGSVYLRGG